MKMFKLRKECLRYWKASKSKRGHHTAKRLQKGKNISERPANGNNRSEFGHWEGDLIVGCSGSKSCILSLAERKNRFYLTAKIPYKTNESVIRVFDDIQNIIGIDSFKSLFKSITFHNGSEIKKYENIELCPFTKKPRTEVYYANAYHSWERGTNENINGFVRKFMPKGTNFDLMKCSQLTRVTSVINYTVRRIIGYVSSYNYACKEIAIISTLATKMGIECPFPS